MSRPNTSTQWRKVADQPLFTMYQHQSEPDRWQIRLKASGNYRRRQVNAASFMEALEAAKALTLGSGPNDSLEATSPTLADVFAMTLRDTRRGETSKREWLASVERFILWLDRRHPLCTVWSHLSRSIIREYVQSFETKAPNTIRLYTQALRQASAFMAREFGCPDVAKGLGVGTKLQKTPPMVLLGDVVDFLDWCRNQTPYLEAGVALQALAGLQLQEALCLTWEKVDLNRGIIEVSGKVKNEYRKRVIPVATRVVEALARQKHR